jgi:type I restriction enzyme R subunit
MNKKTLTEADIRTKFITPAIAGEGGAGWDVMTQVLEEHYFTNGAARSCSGATRHCTSST